jgi:hypothetical protein
MDERTATDATTSGGADRGLRCAGCDRVLEDCAFCERPGCETAICHACLVYELGVSLKQPHRHGG